MALHHGGRCERRGGVARGKRKPRARRSIASRGLLHTKGERFRHQLRANEIGSQERQAVVLEGPASTIGGERRTEFEWRSADDGSRLEGLLQAVVAGKESSRLGVGLVC